LHDPTLWYNEVSFGEIGKRRQSREKGSAYASGACADLLFELK
jgi:hypothetical protein